MYILVRDVDRCGSLDHGFIKEQNPQNPQKPTVRFCIDSCMECTNRDITSTTYFASHG